MLRNIGIIAARELRALFTQPIAYIYTAVIIGLAGYFFALNLAGSILFQGSAPSDMSVVFDIITFLSLFGVPALTMRLLSAETSSGTIEILMTLPVRDDEVVWGKFLAGLIAYIVPLLLSLVYVFILMTRGNPDVGVLATSFLGVFLWGVGLVAIGTFASALTDSQLSAWLLGTGIVLFFYLIEFVAQTGVVDGPVATIISELSYTTHLTSFLRGLIVARDVLYYLLVGLVFLFAAARVMESRRWR